MKGSTITEAMVSEGVRSISYWDGWQEGAFVTLKDGRDGRGATLREAIDNAKASQKRNAA
jgi:hypothetical protein